MTPTLSPVLNKAQRLAVETFQAIGANCAMFETLEGLCGG